MAVTRVSLLLLGQHWKLSLTQHHQIRKHPFFRVFFVFYNINKRRSAKNLIFAVLKKNIQPWVKVM